MILQWKKHGYAATLACAVLVPQAACIHTVHCTQLASPVCIIGHGFGTASFAGSACGLQAKLRTILVVQHQHMVMHQQIDYCLVHPRYSFMTTLKCWLVLQSQSLQSKSVSRPSATKLSAFQSSHAPFSAVPATVVKAYNC